MRYFSYSVFISCLLLLFMMSPGMVGAQGVKLGIQGILKKGDGSAVSDGVYKLTFNLYDVSEGGVALWSEVQNNVAVSSGLYNAVLGSVTDLMLPFNKDYFVGISVGNTPEMSPRLQLTTAPYALSQKGSANNFPSTGAVGIGTFAPSSGYQLHLKKTGGSANQLIEGSNGANIEFFKGVATTTVGLGSLDNILRFNTLNNSSILQYNGSKKLEVNNDGFNITGSASFSNGLTLSAGTALLQNVSISGNTINCPNNLDVKFNGSTKLTVNTEGITMPSHLSITGSKNIFNSGRQARYRRNGNCYGDNCDSDFSSDYSLDCDNRVRATEFNAFSDKRIKKNILTSDSRKDMEILEQLDVTNYRYIDEIQNGKEVKKGFIAQQVEQVFPEAVSRTTDFVPDVYQLAISASLTDGNLTVALPRQHRLNLGDRVKVFYDGEQKDYPVAALPDDFHFTLSGWNNTPPEWLFVYGKQVEDFRQVDYDRIHTLNVSVTQELIRRMEVLENEISDLKNRNAELRNRKARLDEQVRHLEAALSN